MNYTDRLIWGSIVIVVGAVVLPVVVPPLILAAVVGTVCFAVVRVLIYFTRDY